MLFGSGVNKFYKRYASRYIVGIMILMVIDYIQLMIPGIMQGLVDDFTNGLMTKSLLGDYASKIIIIALIVFVGRFTWRHLIFKASRNIEKDLRSDLFKHCEALGQDFYSRNKTGGLLAYYTNDIESIRQSFARGAVLTVDAFFMGTIVIYKMIQLDVTLMFIAFIPMLMVSIIGGITGQKFEKVWDKRQKAFENISDFVTENFYGISVIKAFVKQKEEYLELEKHNKINYDANVRVAKLNAGIDAGITGVIELTFITIMLYGGFLVFKDPVTFSLGKLIGFIFLYDSLIWPMLAIPQIIITHSQAKASLKRYNAILAEEVTVSDDEFTDNSISSINGDIVFKNLNFKYADGNQNVLSNINLTIEQGKTVGIVGKTGCGKTTLVELLLRLYNTDVNSLIIGDKDIRKLPINVLRESFAYVPQDGFLFSDNIENNIALGIPIKERDRSVIERAAKYSAVHDNIIEFPEKYNTIVGERGVTLSGGQKQRVSIARALIKDANYLILDDSVSAVDTGTEETILSNLKELRKDKTTIIISHRISTIRNCDYIAVMEEGRITHVGTHDELLKTSDIYYDIVDRQKLDDISDTSDNFIGGVNDGKLRI